MSIVRTEHNKDNPYVILNKKALEDKNLSWGAKGLWSYLMSRPDNWNISVAHLSKIYIGKGGGEKAIYTLLNELIENGYCNRIQGKKEKGFFSNTEYIITEFKNKVPHSPQRDAVKRGTNKYRSLASNEEQQQAPSGDVVVFQECLMKADISQKDKSSIINYALKNKISKEDFANAINYVTAPDFEVNTTLTKAIMWALKEKPTIPDPVDENKNRDHAKAAEYILSSNSWNLETLSSKVIFTSKTPNNTKTYEINFSEPNFKSKIEKILKQCKFIMHKRKS